MAELYEESHEDLDISSGGTVLEYSYDGAAPKTVICRVEAGSAVAPIEGGTNYIIRASLNGKRVSPDSNVSVASGVTEALLQSREIMLLSGDELAIVLDGAAGDIAVDTSARLIDLTPLTSAAVYGTGTVLVDHDYGGTDNLRYTTREGSSINGAQVQAFLTADYDAGNRAANFVAGQIITNAEGRWPTPMALEPGDYTLVYFKRSVGGGGYGPDTKEITVE